MPRLPKERILRGYKAYAQVFSRGEVLTSGSLKFFYTPQTEPGRTQVGFSVSRTVRSAAIRNRIKRCLREAYRLNNQTAQPEKQFRLVVLYSGPVPPSASLVDYHRLEKDLVRGLHRFYERTLRK